jgi:hypothetical protein
MYHEWLKRTHQSMGTVVRTPASSPTAAAGPGSGAFSRVGSAALLSDEEGRSRGVSRAVSMLGLASADGSKGSIDGDGTGAKDSDDGCGEAAGSEGSDELTNCCHSTSSGGEGGSGAGGSCSCSAVTTVAE